MAIQAGGGSLEPAAWPVLRIRPGMKFRRFGDIGKADLQCKGPLKKSSSRYLPFVPETGA